MPCLNVSVPQFPVLVRAEFLYDFQEGAGQFERGVCHAVTSLEARALGFHVLLDNGAHIGRLPIHALVQRSDAAVVPVDEPWRRQLWSCFSYEVACTEYDWLSGCRVRAMLPNKQTVGGDYLFTLDYYGSQTAESAGENGWKAHNIAALDDGTFCALPNNRLQFFIPSHVTPFETPPKYRTMSREWHVEDGSKWRSTDDGKMFYGLETIDGSH